MNILQRKECESFDEYKVRRGVINANVKSLLGGKWFYRGNKPYNVGKNQAKRERRLLTVVKPS